MIPESQRYVMLAGYSLRMWRLSWLSGLQKWGPIPERRHLASALYWARNYYFPWVARNWVIILRFVHPQKAGERNFFHPASRNQWEAIILGPVLFKQHIFCETSVQRAKALFYNDQMSRIFNTVFHLEPGNSAVIISTHTRHTLVKTKETWNLLGRPVRALFCPEILA